MGLKGEVDNELDSNIDIVAISTILLAYFYNMSELAIKCTYKQE